MLFFYHLFIFFYKNCLRIASFFHKKARLWINGRKHIFDRIAQQINKEDKIIWIHCASLGEFEQGRSLIELIKKNKPENKIFLTFYSPSGYEIRKNYPLADYIFYLPIDTPTNARRFLELVQPEIAIFIKYELWYYYLKTLKEKNIPTYLVSAIFRKEQVFFKWYGGLFREMLACFTHIFVQNETSLQLLQQIYLNNISIAGDTRIDRVWSIAQKAKSFSLIKHFVGNHPILVVGSSWPEDERILADFINEKSAHFSEWKYIIAPHEIEEKKLENLEALLKQPVIRYSFLKNEQKQLQGEISKPNILIIDNIGMLSALYRYGKVAYIGGGFGTGIHNTLEPIAFGLPVIFGPKYQKFEEANYLVQSKGGFSIKNTQELEKVMIQLEKKDFYQKASENAKAYILKNQGATKVVFEKIF